MALVQDSRCPCKKGRSGDGLTGEGQGPRQTSRAGRRAAWRHGLAQNPPRGHRRSPPCQLTLDGQPLGLGENRLLSRRWCFDRAATGNSHGILVQVTSGQLSYDTY